MTNVRNGRVTCVFASIMLSAGIASPLHAQSSGFEILITLDGRTGSDRFGQSVSAAGDVNGDGFEDVIVGAPYDGPGLARVHSGIDGSVLFSFNGNLANGGFGWSVSGIGDINADGHGEVIVGAPFDAIDGTDGGVVRVYSGEDGSLMHTLSGGNSNDRYGNSVSGAGDVNGDGIGDIVVGAPWDDNNGSSSGSVFVYSGADWSLLHIFNGDGATFELGHAVSAAGDVNGDGYDDIVAGAPYYDSPTLNLIGRVRVFSGLDGSVLHTVDGVKSGDQLGFSVSGAGDVNGDDRCDFIVGVLGDDTNGDTAGSALVYSGIDGTLLYEFYGDGALDMFGRSVSGAGDVNGDGYGDVIVGAPGDNTFGAFGGSARVLSGLDGKVLATLYGDNGLDHFGWSVSGAGDVNGDGLDDLIVGAPEDDNNGNNAGTARVFLRIPRACADQNEDGQVTPADFSAWIANFNAMSLVADVNQDMLVTPADFSAWIGAFNLGASGPVCMP